MVRFEGSRFDRAMRRHVVPRLLVGGTLDLVLVVLLASLSLAVGLHVGDPIAIAVDLAACAAAASIVRWPRVGGVVLGLVLIVYLAAPHSWSEMGEYAAMIPILGTGVRNQRRERLAMTLGYGLILVAIQVRAYPTDVRWLLGSLIWATLIAVLWLLGSGITAFVKAQDTARVAALTQQRLGLARDLHDTVARTLSQLSRQAHQAAANDDAAALRLLAAGIGKAASELRWLLGALREPDDRPALTSTSSLADTFKAVLQDLKAAGFTVSATIEGDLDAVPRPAADVLADISREAAANIERHGAPGRPCAIVASLDGGWADIAFINEVPAAERDKSAGSPLGLIGATERLASIGGQLDARREGQQWITRVTIPLPRQE